MATWPSPTPAESRPLRIAVANQGDPADPAAFSGAPAALLEGLRAAGAEAISVPGALPPAGERALMRAAMVARLRPRDLGLRAAIARERAPAQLGRLAEAAHDVRLPPACGPRRPWTASSSTAPRCGCRAGRST